MKKYNVFICETRIITTDMNIEAEADSQAEAEDFVMACLESSLLRNDIVSDDMVTEDYREYEVVSTDEDFVDGDDDTDQLTLPESVIEKVQEMPAARR